MSDQVTGVPSLLDQVEDAEKLFLFLRGFESFDFAKPCISVRRTSRLYIRCRASRKRYKSSKAAFSRGDAGPLRLSNQ